MVGQVLGLLDSIANVVGWCELLQGLLGVIGQAINAVHKVPHGLLGDTLATSEGLELLIGLWHSIPGGGGAGGQQRTEQFRQQSFTNSVLQVTVR